jgi:hypothetical protein
MGRTACTQPQCLYSRAIPLLPLWAVQPVQSLSARTRVHFTFTFISHREIYRRTNTRRAHRLLLLLRKERPNILNFLKKKIYLNILYVFHKTTNVPLNNSIGFIFVMKKQYVHCEVGSVFLCGHVFWI